MSNTFSIAAVTSTLHQLLLRVKNPQPGDPPADPALVGADVTVRPLDQARQDTTIPQLNLFLYQVTHNAQLRNNANLPPNVQQYWKTAFNASPEPEKKEPMKDADHERHH